MIEKFWDLISPVKYHEQHINPQIPGKLKRLVESQGFKLISMGTIFLFTPFVALISDKLAYKLSFIEKKIIGNLGCIVLAVFEKK
jgi:hypothetical protein